MMVGTGELFGMKRKTLLYIGRWVYIIFGIPDLAGLILSIIYKLPYKDIQLFILYLGIMIAGGIIIESRIKEEKHHK